MSTNPSPISASPPLFWSPADDGFLGGNSDPSSASGGGLLVAGTLYMARINVRAATTFTNLFYGVSAVGTGASTGSFVGLYSAAGVLLSGSADQGAALAGTTGYKQAALTTPQAVAAGAVVYAAVLCNLATSQPSLMRQQNSVNASPQAVQANATQRWGAFAAQGTALPANLAMGGMVGTSLTNIFLWN